MAVIEVCEIVFRLRCIKPPRSGFAWLDAYNRKPKAELLWKEYLNRGNRI